ncbi:MAG: efflux RND transporter periplasmic adaptor subunit [Phycisphaerae bacterium]
MKKIYIAQTSLVFCLAAGLVIGIPTFLMRMSNSSRTGVLLVNGRIEGVEVAIGTKLPGRIAKVHVHEGQEVRAGTPLVELEANDVQAAYEQAQANVRQAQSNMESSNEQVFRAREQLAKTKIGLEYIKRQTDLNTRQASSAVKEAEAAVDQSKALLNKVRTEFNHAAKLQKEKAASDLEYDNARDALRAQEAGERMAELKLEQARDSLSLAEARKSEIKMQEHDLAVMESSVRQATSAVGIAKAQVQAAEASTKMVEIQLRDTKIVAPCDGIVVTRVVEPGEVVTAGATTVVIVDFDKLYLKGYLPNNQVSQIKLNDPAHIFLDAFPDKIFEARVTRVNQQAEFTPKSVDTPQQRVKLVFGVELQVSNPARTFKPGMPADAVIKVVPSAEWCLPADLR